MRKQPVCNLDLVTDLMTYSKFGPMSEVFIVTAIQKYAESITSVTHGELMRQMGEHPVVQPATWSDIAHDVRGRMNAFYNRHVEPVEPFISDEARAMYAAFLMEGLRDVGTYNEIVKKLDKGCIDMVADLNYFIEPIRAMELAAQPLLGDHKEYPAVFEYEVVSSFGEWYGKHVLEHGSEPDIEVALDQIQGLVIDFFAQHVDLDRTKLAVAVQAERNAIMNR